MLSKEDYEVADEYYIATITDFCDGISIEVLDDVLRIYEEEEDYIACMGIKRALDALREVLNNEQIKQEDENRRD